MTPILLTTTNEKQPDCSVVWDLLGGCPIATLSGEVAHPGSLMPFNGGIACAALKKPFIQYWNFKTANFASRRILTKSLVSALDLTPDGEYVFVACGRDVYVYQTASGCLVAVLGGSHSTTIGAVKLISYDLLNPYMLVTTDNSGFLACWSLVGIMDNLSLLCSSATTLTGLPNDDTPTTTQSDAKHSPLWYSVHTGHGLPRFVVVRKLLVVASTEGLKLFDLFTGAVLGAGLTGILGGIHSVCRAPYPDERLFCGGSNGLLYSTYIEGTKKYVACDKEVRRCFASSKLPSAQKSITELCIPSFDPNFLIVGSHSGLIEVLRLDSILSCLQQFSVVNPVAATEPSSHCQLTGLCVVPRPDWLSNTNQSSYHKTDSEPNDEEITNATVKNVCGVDPLKRHFGWCLDDLVRVWLPNTDESSSDQNSIYMDDFDDPLLSIESDQTPSTDMAAELDRLTKANRELLRKLVDYELRS